MFFGQGWYSTPCLASAAWYFPTQEHKSQMNKTHDSTLITPKIGVLYYTYYTIMQPWNVKICGKSRLRNLGPQNFPWEPEISEKVGGPADPVFFFCPAPTLTWYDGTSTSYYIYFILHVLSSPKYMKYLKQVLAIAIMIFIANRHTNLN